MTFALMGLAACTDKVDYEPTEMPAGQEVYFPNNGQTTFALATDQSSVAVEVLRTNSADAVSVPVTATATVGGAATSIFNVPATVNFAAGSKQADITISFDFSQIEPDTEYTVTLKIDGADRSAYGLGEQTVTISYAPWSDWKKLDGDGTYTPAFYSWGIPDVPVSIYVRNSLINPDNVEYLIPGLYDDDFILQLNKKTNVVTIPRFDTGDIDDDDSVIYGIGSSSFGWSGDYADFNEPSEYDPERGLFTLSITFYSNLGAWAPVTEYVQLPGFADLNVYFANAGTLISEDNIEYTMVDITKSNDLAAFTYTFKQGYLDEDEIKAIVKEMEEDENPTFETASGTFKFPVTEEDYYTLITVGYDEGYNPVCYNVFRFYVEINGVDWNAGWISLGKIKYTDGFFAGAYYNDAYTWLAEIQENNDYPGYYRVVKPYADAPFASEWDIERGHYYVYIDATDPDDVWVDVSYICYGAYVASLTSGKMADGKITFPANSLGFFGGYDEKGNQIWYALWDEPVDIVNFNEDDDDEDLEDDEEVAAAAQNFHAPMAITNSKVSRKPAKMSARMDKKAAIKARRAAKRIQQ